MDAVKLKEYSKEDIHKMIINGEIDHDFICEYISKRDKVYNMLIDENEKLKRESRIKDKWCQFIIDVGFDYDGYQTEPEMLKHVIDELVRYAHNAIKNDDETVVYSNDYEKFNIIYEKVGE